MSVQTLQAGHPARRKLDALQAQITSIKAELEQVERAPLPLDAARAQIDRALTAQLEREGHKTGAILAYRRRRERRAALPTLPDAESSYWHLALLAGAGDIARGKAALVDALMVPLKAAEKQQPGIGTAERDKRLIDLRAKLESHERKEELEILRLEHEERWTVVRRGDASVDLLLEIWADSCPEPAPDAPAEPLKAGRPRHINGGSGELYAPPSTK